jgi:hypothetical protein
MINSTEREHWEKYWQNSIIIKDTAFFRDLNSLNLDFPYNSKIIEIGGFPGKIAVYFLLKYNSTVTVFDYFIDPQIIRRVEDIFEVPDGSINCIEGDFLTSEIRGNYDLVCSFGFIEHFENTKELIERHLKCLNKGGTLFITIPNFKGINGKIQKSIDFENYKIHNIECMNIPFLRKISEELKLTNTRIGYFGIPSIWVEKKAKLNSFTSFTLKIMSKLIAHLPFKNSKFLAPFIYLYGIKSY